MSRSNPYIPAGCDQQGRHPAAAPARAPRLLATLQRHYLAWLLRDLQQQIDTVADELAAEARDAQAAALRHRHSPRANARRRELRRQMAELVQRHRAVRQEMDNISPALTPSKPRAPAITAAAGLVLAACGGGGSDEEPQPRPQVDCAKTPEQCK
jgi:ElaB/YqjD/DUF883 family membrane-anchored ribosome-binding protein